MKQDKKVKFQNIDSENNKLIFMIKKNFYNQKITNKNIVSIR